MNPRKKIALVDIDGCLEQNGKLNLALVEKLRDFDEIILFTQRSKSLRLIEIYNLYLSAFRDNKQINESRLITTLQVIDALQAALGNNKPIRVSTSNDTIQDQDCYPQLEVSERDCADKSKKLYDKSIIDQNSPEGKRAFEEKRRVIEEGIHKEINIEQMELRKALLAKNPLERESFVRDNYDEHDVKGILKSLEKIPNDETLRFDYGKKLYQPTIKRGQYRRLVTPWVGTDVEIVVFDDSRRNLDEIEQDQTQPLKPTRYELVMNLNRELDNLGLGIGIDIEAYKNDMQKFRMALGEDEQKANRQATRCAVSLQNELEELAKLHINKVNEAKKVAREAKLVPKLNNANLGLCLIYIQNLSNAMDSSFAYMEYLQRMIQQQFRIVVKVPDEIKLDKPPQDPAQNEKLQSLLDEYNAAKTLYEQASNVKQKVKAVVSEPDKNSIDEVMKCMFEIATICQTHQWLANTTLNILNVNTNLYSYRKDMMAFNVFLDKTEVEASINASKCALNLHKELEELIKLHNEKKGEANKSLGEQKAVKSTKDTTNLSLCLAYTQDLANIMDTSFAYMEYLKEKILQHKFKITIILDEGEVPAVVTADQVPNDPTQQKDLQLYLDKFNAARELYAQALDAKQKIKTVVSKPNKKSIDAAMHGMLMCGKLYDKHESTFLKEEDRGSIAYCKSAAKSIGRMLLTALAYTIAFFTLGYHGKGLYDKAWTPTTADEKFTYGIADTARFFKSTHDKYESREMKAEAKKKRTI